MKKPWDIISILIALAGLCLAVIFINIFINPYSFLNPFPPTRVATSTPANTVTPSQQALPELWTATPETPGVPSATALYPLGVAPTNTRVILPSRTNVPFKTYTKTPNWQQTYAYRTPTRTYTPSSDMTPPTNPGNPVTSSPTTDSTPTWSWTASTDAWSGVNYYQVAWGLDINCGNPVYMSGGNIWTAPTITTNAVYYICVRAVDRAGNLSNWVGPSGFFYSGSIGTATSTSTSTRTPTVTNTFIFTPTFTNTSTVTFTPTITLSPTTTFTSVMTSTATSTSTITNTPTNTITPTVTDTIASTFTETSTATLTLTQANTETATVTPTQTDTLMPTSTFTETQTPTITDTATITLTPTLTLTLTTMPSTFTISGNTGVGPTATPSGAPVPAVSITVTGDPGAVITQPDGLGNFSVVVPANWSGKISPARIGYLFTPVYYTYTNVTTNFPDQNFTSVEVATFTISGNVGVAPGTVVIADNGAVVTLQPELDGNYSVVVPSTWSGTIKPTHATCTYVPPQMDFIGVGGNLVDQNFTPTCP